MEDDRTVAVVDAYHVLIYGTRRQWPTRKETDSDDPIS
jgi:hypothetical protein